MQIPALLRACTNMTQASGMTIGSQACIPVPSNIFRKLFYSVVYKGGRSLLQVTESGCPIRTKQIHKGLTMQHF